MGKIEIYHVKFYALVGIVAISYFLGFILGFAFCASSTKSYADPIPAVMNTQNMQSNVNTQTIYFEGQKYIVFTSGSSSMAVIKK